MPELTVTQRQVLDAVPILNHLARQPIQGAAVFSFNRTKKDVESLAKEIEPGRLEIIDRFAEKDDEGNVIADERTHQAKFADGQRELFDEAINEYLDDRTVTFRTRTLEAEWFASHQIVPAMLEAIDFLFDEPEAEE